MIWDFVIWVSSGIWVSVRKERNREVRRGRDVEACDGYQTRRRFSEESADDSSSHGWGFRVRDAFSGCLEIPVCMFCSRVIWTVDGASNVKLDGLDCLDGLHKCRVIIHLNVFSGSRLFKLWATPSMVNVLSHFLFFFFLSFLLFCLWELYMKNKMRGEHQIKERIKNKGITWYFILVV